MVLGVVWFVVFWRYLVFSNFFVWGSRYLELFVEFCFRVSDSTEVVFNFGCDLGVLRERGRVF